MKHLLSIIILFCCFGNALHADDACRVLIVVGPSTHPPGSHEVAAGGRVMKHFYKNWLNDDLRCFILNGIAWSAKLDVPGELFDASRNRKISFLIRFPKECGGLAAIVLLSHGGYGSSFGQYAYIDLATTFARFGFLVVNIGHRPSANEMQHRYDRPLDVAELRIPGGGSEGSLPMPEECQYI